LKEILYIGGAGRSGSTLLDMILGNVPGFFSLGETLDFWQHASIHDMRCGCGEMLEKCPFWSVVIHRLVKDHGISFTDAVRLKKELDRTRTLPLRSFNQFTHKKDQSVYGDYLSALYAELADMAGGRILVDSSKTPAHLSYLSGIPGIRIHVLHLVRDPRAVAYSWKKRAKRELGAKDKDSHMDKRSYLNAIFRWMMENRFVQLFGKRQYAYAVLRYEDFTDSPYETLNATLRALDLPDADVSILRESELKLEPTHSVGGNPMRFCQVTTIRRDDAWKKKMSPLTQCWLGLVSLPQLINYNYDLLQRID